MIPAKLPHNEAERLAALKSYAVLDTDAEQVYDDLTRIASEICDTPIALVSLVDSDRQWFKSRVGLDATETPRDVAFCAHAILDSKNVFVVNDSFADVRFADNPLATGAPHVRFYAGAPLVSSEGLPLGTLCVIDKRARDISPKQLETLAALSRQVVAQLELRRSHSALRELSSTLERRNLELQRFTSVAAHDLREPLRKMVTCAQFLKEDAGDELNRDAANDLHYIVDAAQRMDKMVNGLFQLARSDVDPLEKENVDLSICVAHAKDALEGRIRDSHATIDVGELPQIRADGPLMTQVFQNLLGNAMKFCKNSPHVKISCEKTGPLAVVRIEDNGIGVEPDKLQSIFAPFTRLHSAKEYEGVGIGLALVQRIVERHGEKIWVESSPGKGTTFCFTVTTLAA